MGEIALIADRETATLFRLSGIKRSFAVKDGDEAKKIISELIADEGVSLIITTDEVHGWVEPILGKIKKEYPLVVAIPSPKGPKATKDTLAELIKRTIGIELVGK